MKAATAVLLVIDLQDKLLGKIVDHEQVVTSIAFLIDAAKLLDVPVQATEQYPKGLGPTTASIAERLPRPRPEKTAFSCWAVPEVRACLTPTRRSVVLTGIETHVCVLQTALDLLDDGVRVHIPVDAVGSRTVLDRDTALRRLERAGAVLTTAETVVFEWVGDATHPRFKEISTLVKARTGG